MDTPRYAAMNPNRRRWEIPIQTSNHSLQPQSLKPSPILPQNYLEDSMIQASPSSSVMNSPEPTHSNTNHHSNHPEVANISMDLLTKQIQQQLEISPIVTTTAKPILPTSTISFLDELLPPKENKNHSLLLDLNVSIDSSTTGSSIDTTTPKFDDFVKEMGISISNSSSPTSVRYPNHSKNNNTSSHSLLSDSLRISLQQLQFQHQQEYLLHQLQTNHLELIDKLLFVFETQFVNLLQKQHEQFFSLQPWFSIVKQFVTFHKSIMKQEQSFYISKKQMIAKMSHLQQQQQQARRITATMTTTKTKTSATTVEEMYMQIIVQTVQWFCTLVVIPYLSLFLQQQHSKPLTQTLQKCMQFTYTWMQLLENQYQQVSWNFLSSCKSLLLQKLYY